MAREQDPIRRKAASTAANFVIEGIVKIDFFDALFRQAINTPCKYCGTILTLNNMNVDHIEPLGSRTTRRQRLPDRPENLQVICRGCNQEKGDLSDEKYRKLLGFLSEDIELYEYVTRKLRQSALTFKR
jgi:hypothetical protein